MNEDAHQLVCVFHLAELAFPSFCMSNFQLIILCPVTTDFKARLEQCGRVDLLASNVMNMPEDNNRQDDQNARDLRGFASMDPNKQKEIARLGGVRAHQSGNAHEFTPAEAKEAGRLGGLKRAENRRRAMAEKQGSNRQQEQNEEQAFSE